MLTLAEAATFTRLPIEILKQDVANGAIPRRGTKAVPLVSKGNLSAHRYNPTMSVAQGAAYAGLQAGTLRELCRRGKIDGARQMGEFWVVARRALDAYNALDKVRGGRPRKSESRA